MPAPRDVGATPLDTPQPRSLKADDVAAAVRKALANGEFGPGAPLSEYSIEAHLKQRNLDVSRMPIRKALAQLEAEGIVDVIPKKGTFVRRIDKDELRQIWDSRIALEEFVLVQLANAAHPDLTKARATHAKMARMIVNKKSAATPEQQVRFAALDEQFHAELADAAGYPKVASEVALLRLKLQIAVQAEGMAAKRLRPEVVREHADLLAALAPPPDSDWVRADVNVVRLAYRVHMRNSARLWWKIEQRIRPDASSGEFGPNYVFDVPDLSAVGRPAEQVPVGLMLIMRLSIELCAVRELVSRPLVETSTLEAINREMHRLAAGGAMHPAEKAEFLKLDVRFHSALVFAAGMLCAEEVVAHAWAQIARRADYDRGVDRCQEIVREHSRIIAAIRYSRGTPADLQEATEALAVHLTHGFRSNNFRGPVVTRIQADAAVVNEVLQKALLDRVPEGPEH